MTDIPSLLLLAYRAEPGGKGALAAVEAARKLCEESGNAVYAWVAYRECRAAGLELPDWVLEYFDFAAEGMWRLWQEPPQKENGIAPAVAEALGMKMRGLSAFARANEVDWVFLGNMVARAVQEIGKEYLAVDEVASRSNKSRATVQRAWNRYKKFIGDT